MRAPDAKIYSPPTVTGELGRHDSVVARNHLASAGSSASFCDEIDKINVDDLIDEFGSPLFVFSERTVLEAARRARKAFKRVYPNTTFGWSYKTNYLKAICNLFHKEGWIAEVVSDFEYRKAELAGIPGEDIIYNGPCKSRASLERALGQGALVQIDNWDELGAVEEITSTMDRCVSVGIRVWMDTGFAPTWAKFGFASANGEAARAALRVAANPRLRLHTLHTHIGTYILEPRAYAVAAQHLLALRSAVSDGTGYLVPCVNLGGGFPSGGLLHGQPENMKAPPIEDYAAAIAGVLNQLPRKLRPMLRLETGRHLIDDAGYLVTSVAAVKGHGAYIVDAGVHLLYTAAWFKVGVQPTRPPRQPTTGTAKLYGCLCMNIDVIREQVELPPLEVNDKLVLHPVGAYNLTQSMQFIDLRPAVVLIGLDGSPHVIRRREVLDDVERAEQVPTHLRLCEKGAPTDRLSKRWSRDHNSARCGEKPADGARCFSRRGAGSHFRGSL